MPEQDVKRPPFPSQKSQPEREKTEKPVSTYAHTDKHTTVHSRLGHNADDTPMARAWSRLHDQQKRLGPALDDAYIDDEENEEVQHFAYGYGIRSLAESNVNKTVRFYDARGFIAEESGL